MKEINVNSENFKSVVMESDVPVLADFWAAWCGPCRVLAPAVSAIADEYADRIKVVKINVDEEMQLASMFAVSSIPTVLIFNNGKVVKKSVGLVPKAQLSALLSDLV